MAPRAANARPWPSLLAVLAMSSAAFAGCSGQTFSVDLPLWSAGYAWEYDETAVDSVSVVGEAPAGVEEDTELGSSSSNATFRLEVFNSTAASVEGIPIYALAVLHRPLFAENETPEEPVEDAWDAWVFSEDLNYVEPTFVDWRNQEVQLSGDEGGVAPDGETNETSETDNVTEFNRPSSEHRLLDWPLAKGRHWRHAEVVPFLNIDGLLTGKTRSQGLVRTPAGNFTSIQIHATLVPLDLSELEVGIRQGLEAQGGQVKTLSFNFQVDYDYAYSDEVKNLVRYEQVQTITLTASGVDAEGQNYDFTFEQTASLSRVLVTFQLLQGIERPLSFALDVLRGAYDPKPITPASHLAVEILTTKQSLNRFSDDKMVLGVRIYNSTGGEKRLRPVDESFPMTVSETQFDAEYDHQLLEVVWQLQHLDGRGHSIDFQTSVADRLDLPAREFKVAGLKNIIATLKLKDTASGPGQVIFRDVALVEVYTWMNLTFERLATNVTPPNDVLQVAFPVDAGGLRASVIATLLNPSGVPEPCPVAAGGGGGGGGGQQSSDCLRVSDAQNRRVADEQTARMRFETSRVGQFSAGNWKAEFFPSAPGEKVNFEIVVRYRPGF